MNNLIGIIIGLILLVIGLSNLFLVHPVPGLIFILISLFYFPFTDNFLKKRFGFSVPTAVKIILALILIWFTLGVSDLGEMID